MSFRRDLRELFYICFRNSQDEMLLCENYILIVEGIRVRHIDDQVELLFLEHCPQLVSVPLFKKDLAVGEQFIKAGEAGRSWHRWSRSLSTSGRS